MARLPTKPTSFGASYPLDQYPAILVLHILALHILGIARDREDANDGATTHSLR